MLVLPLLRKNFASTEYPLGSSDKTVEFGYRQ